MLDRTARQSRASTARRLRSIVSVSSTHVKLAEKLKQIQQDVEAINKVMQATYRKEFARAAHQIAHDLMSLRPSLAHKLDEELPVADGYQICFGDDTKRAKRD
jgi:phosphoglycerate-specific signal transduction histidine kinase